MLRNEMEARVNWTFVPRYREGRTFLPGPLRQQA